MRSALAREPRVRSDGLCALRTCRKPLGKLAREMKDPFHSSLCVRAHYGVVFEGDEASAKYLAARGGKISQPTDTGRRYMESGTGFKG